MSKMDIFSNDLFCYVLPNHDFLLCVLNYKHGETILWDRTGMFGLASQRGKNV